LTRRSLARPLLFLNKPPDGAHQMDFGDVDAAFPENFCDPVDVKAAAMGLDDLSLIFSQGVNLRLFAVTPAFGAARDLQEIFGSGFEIIRIRVSQWGITAGFSEFMIKQWQFGDQIHDHNRGAGRDHPEASCG
jgi:hypothetical protein